MVEDTASRFVFPTPIALSPPILSVSDGVLGYDQRVEVMETMQIVTDLKAYRAAGKPIFDLEYAVEKAPEAYRLSRKNGFIPYCTRAALNQLSSTPPPE